MKRNARFQQRGDAYVLPIIGRAVSEIRIRWQHYPWIHFSSDSQIECRLEFDPARATLSRGHWEHQIRESKPGEDWNPRSLSPLIDLLGCSVEDAIAAKHGTLHLRLSEG